MSDSLFRVLKILRKILRFIPTFQMLFYSYGQFTAQHEISQIRFEMMRITLVHLAGIIQRGIS